VDIAERRAESYPSPGALPEVRPGSVLEDLQRRDFTVNAIAVTLGGPAAAEMSAVEHAREDLTAGRLRVLYDASFLDDPTRLLRLARYAARLGFDAEADTAELAQRALSGGAMRTLSLARAGSELRLALGEAGAPASLARMGEMGLPQAIDPVLGFDHALAEEALALLPADGRADVLLLACMLPRSREQAGRMLTLLERLEIPAGERDLAIAAAAGAEELAGKLTGAARPSELMRAARGSAVEAIALAGAAAGSEARSAAERWLGGLRDVRLSINGDDLLSAGVARGPEVGRRLDLALERRLDGEIDGGPAAELAAALEGA
jgi:tRNA nucleotidyltransferase (CCA-adding enzyme)